MIVFITRNDAGRILGSRDLIPNVVISVRIRTIILNAVEQLCLSPTTPAVKIYAKRYSRTLKNCGVTCGTNKSKTDRVIKSEPEIASI